MENSTISEKIICSFSGGETSAYMANLLLKNYDRDNLIFVFANTGKENEATLEFVRKVDEYFELNLNWIEAVINPVIGKGTNYKKVDFDTASRNGEPFEAVHAKYGLSNKNFPHCTRELKETPIRKFVLNEVGKKFKMAIGIRADERVRVNLRRAAKFNWIYPLVFDMPSTKADVKGFWEKQPFQLQLHNYQGNCDLCWKKSLNKRLKILNENPKIGDWWENQEKKYGEDYVFDRDGFSISELRKKATEKAKQLSIFSLDNESQCSCFSNIV